MGKIILITLLIGCSSNIPSHSLYDKYDKLHRYNEQITSKVTTKYCQEHLEWEDIRTVYTEKGVKYVVYKDKK